MSPGPMHIIRGDLHVKAGESYRRGGGVRLLSEFHDAIHTLGANNYYLRYIQHARRNYPSRYTGAFLILGILLANFRVPP